MKIIFLFAQILLAVSYTFAQMFTLPIYILDAQGNKDTVYILGDPLADSELNPQFGEIDLNGIPYDSVFEARLTYDVFSSVRIESKKQALYYDCPDIGTIGVGMLVGHTLLVRCSNWPLTVKWDRKIVDSLQLCISESGISNTLSYFGGQGPLYKLNSRDSVVFSTQHLSSYFNSGLNNGNSAPIYVVAIGTSGRAFTSIGEVENVQLKINVNNVTKRVKIESNIDNEAYEAFFVDLMGALIGKYRFDSSIDIDLSYLPNSIFFLLIKQIKNDTLICKKIIYY